MMKNRFGPNFGTTSMRIDYGTLTITEEELANDSEELSESFNTLNALSDD